MNSHVRDLIADALVLAALVYVLVPGLAYAYLDPGSTSLIWQVLLAGGLAALYMGRRYWARIKHLLGMAPATESTEDGGADDDD